MPFSVSHFPFSPWYTNYVFNRQETGVLAAKPPKNSMSSKTNRGKKTAVTCNRFLSVSQPTVIPSCPHLLIPSPRLSEQRVRGTTKHSSFCPKHTSLKLYSYCESLHIIILDGLIYFFYLWKHPLVSIPSPETIILYQSGMNTSQQQGNLEVYLYLFIYNLSSLVLSVRTRAGRVKNTPKVALFRCLLASPTDPLDDFWLWR